MKKTFIILLTCLSILTANAQPEDQLKVDVHPGVELFTIIQILADQYPKPNPLCLFQRSDSLFFPLQRSSSR